MTGTRSPIARGPRRNAAGNPPGDNPIEIVVAVEVHHARAGQDGGLLEQHVDRVGAGRLDLGLRHGEHADSYQAARPTDRFRSFACPIACPDPLVCPAPDGRADQQAILLLANLSRLESEVAAGCVVVIGRGRAQVRPLPLLGNPPNQRP